MQNHLDNPEQRRIRENTEKVKGTFGRMYKAFFNTIIVIILIAGIGAYIQGKFKNDKILKLNKYKDMLLEQNSTMCLAIDYEIQYINSRDKATFNKAVEYFKKCNDMNKEISGEINEVLESNGMRH